MNLKPTKIKCQAHKRIKKAQIERCPKNEFKQDFPVTEMLDEFLVLKDDFSEMPWVDFSKWFIFNRLLPTVKHMNKVSSWEIQSKLPIESMVDDYTRSFFLKFIEYKNEARKMLDTYELNKIRIDIPSSDPNNFYSITIEEMIAKVHSKRANLMMSDTDDGEFCPDGE